jgi:hypothetical protein
VRFALVAKFTVSCNAESFRGTKVKQNFTLFQLFKQQLKAAADGIIIKLFNKP